MSSWDTSSGLLESFTLETQEVWFGTNDKYNQGQTLLLNLKGPASVDGDIVDPEHHLMLSCGDKWKAGQGGAVAINTTGSENFNSQSAVGRLIDGIKDLGEDALSVMKTRGESFEADTWQGLSIDFERVMTGKFKDRVTGEEREVHNYLPRSLSVAGSAAPAAKAEAKASGNAGGKAAAAKLKIAVKKFAADFESNDDFIAAVLDPGSFDQAEEVEANEELLDAVVSGEIFAEAH